MAIKKNNSENNEGLPPKKRKSSSIEITKSEKAMIEELFRNAINDYSTKFQAKQIERHDLVNKISSFISEFLSAFMIIGYDMKGAPVNIVHGGSQMDMDALNSALNKFIFNIHNNNE